MEERQEGQGQQGQQGQEKQGGRRLWDRMDDEPIYWFQRFEVYRSMGARRSIGAVYRYMRDAEIDPELYGQGPGAPWYEKAREWNWRERAEAYDTELMRQFREEEEEIRVQARLERIVLIRDRLREVNLAVAQAQLDTLTKSEAREMLRDLRPLLMDLIRAERLEMGEATERTEDAAQAELVGELERLVNKVYSGAPAADEPAAEGEA